MSQMPYNLPQQFPASQKVYVVGSRPDIRVPMREISLTPTLTQQGREENPPLRVYDTSGPYTNPDAQIDIRRGLPTFRRPWITERNDVEEYEGRPVQPLDNGEQTCPHPQDTFAHTT